MREESENQRISRIRESHACILRVCSKKISGGLILHASGTVHCTGLRIPRGLQLYSYHARTAVISIDQRMRETENQRENQRIRESENQRDNHHHRPVVEC